MTTITVDDLAACRRCGRPLHAITSRALGLGPSCADALAPSSLEALAATAAAATAQLSLDWGDDGREAA
ncbi:DUF6011 domain-containing protein [Frankia sp. AgB32]|uniref:DUF6011 domain-containing protein n=1 Tax=Frankia sp. AgB32 TaxID=631119 RepID=UPI00200F8393|nr:DUF6011 domain-containing protein [Frankia sp. AgB32]MCK9895228.1 DUF6011 domain-containing protein [Frankia sp. AgB32]